MFTEKGRQEANLAGVPQTATLSTYQPRGTLAVFICADAKRPSTITSPLRHSSIGEEGAVILAQLLAS